VVRRALERLTPKDAFCLACLPAIGQEHVLSVLPEGAPFASRPPAGARPPASPKPARSSARTGAADAHVPCTSTEPDVEERLAHLAHRLSHVEDFYDSIGGLGGYQLQCLLLLPDAEAGSSVPATAPAAGGASLSRCAFLDPVGLDLADAEQDGAAAAAVRAGLEALPHMAEIYPLGGAGDRLGLVCERTGEALPTAVLPYCGRSLLESLVRDLQAREIDMDIDMDIAAPAADARRGPAAAAASPAASAAWPCLLRALGPRGLPRPKPVLASRPGELTCRRAGRGAPAGP
jgi:hypothetical protein